MIDHASYPIKNLWHVHAPVQCSSCHDFTLSLSLLQEPALRLCVMHLKYADWRQAFTSAWKGVGKLGREGNVESRAEKLLQAFEATCHAMHIDDGDSDGCMDLSKAWADNLGHNIAFVSSPLSLLARLGIVRKCPLNARGALRLGTQADATFLRRLCSKRARPRVLSLLVRWVNFADALGDVVAPRTCRDWVEQFDNVQMKMRQHRPCLLTPPARP